MIEVSSGKPVKIAKLPEEKTPSIGRMSMSEVDAALMTCEKNIKSHVETVKTKLNSNASISPEVLRDLSKGNSLKTRLVMRRIALLIETGDAAALELLDKLMKVKPARPAVA